MANVYTLKLTNEQEQHLYQTFQNNAIKPPQYAKWALRLENCNVTCYTSGKTVFQGKDASIYASSFLEKKTNSLILPQAGSDEVGTGDYFGPVCVCASIVDETIYSFIQDLGIKDSKQLNDADILKMAPYLLEKVPHSLLILQNEKYNIVHQENNLNAIKAKLHNQAYVHLQNKYGLPAFKIIDQFTPEASYYKYIKHEKTIIQNIHFETKAENKYVSVATSSIIARFAFLKTMEEMEKKWDMSFQKGAGEKVDICAKQFVQRYGMENLQKVAKLHFKNTENL